MKIKTILTIFTAIALLVQMPILSHSQTNDFTPASFSVFSIPQNIGLPINSADNENAAFVAPNGLSLYFSGNGTGTLGSGDLWVSQRATLTSAWGTPQNLGAVINTADIENQPNLSLDGKTMFFNSDRSGGVGRQDLFMTTRTNPNDDFGWTAPVNLTAVNSTAAEVGAAYFEDPTNGIATLYFASDRGKPQGLDDIFQSTRNPDGTFNPPTAVTELNSPLQNAYPKLRRDGLEIFFHSTRDGGLGGLDIWTSTRASTSSMWNPPVNVQSLNTADFDGTPSLSPDGSVLYFASTRNGGNGGLDIYTAVRASINRTPTADFDGDGRTDLSVFRPSDGTWYILNSGSNTYRVQPFGANGDKIVPGDYDGDARTDLAVFRVGVWWILRSSDNTFSVTQFGLAADKPAPADFDGDGKTDIAVYRNGTWIIRRTDGSESYQQFGLASDIPIAGVNQ